MRRIAFLILLATLCSATVMAKGRRPDDDDSDRFPDYNRLEMHPKPKDEQAPPPAVSDKPVPNAAAPAVNAPLSPVDDTTPLPPPKAVPVSDDSSEPPMPDSIKDTLTQGTTDQK